ncbi:uncharacterized protein P174DRAFT_462376 [Aspergillus novofumigatus IBT 16806]|uniref:Esterase-like protein n=1 Tax=Aspergillus novofumigatus (strain IBT 16806) TaxID=1392255 RepID=A0A2I1C2N0_ASPN1|nr:uncharacterized protein P174DRAFT_462376 [Aspergillus novofumigatus IBT 16806]PKX91869.1 hypothetical protein P174DRAFT_462376 [Aspergillus novofumigatus IBT 16806]
MECCQHRVSYASWRVATFRQLFLTSANPVSSHRILRRGISSSIGRDESRSPESQNEADPQEVDQADVLESGEAPSQTAQSVRPSQLLPQSPLLTKALPGVEKKRKKRPTQSDADRLRLNPWAVALASPLRMCAVTGTRLPREFFTDWGLIHRPDDEGLWFMPVGLLRDEISTSKVAQADRDDQAEQLSPKNKSFRSLTLRIIDRLPLLKDLTIPLARNKSGRRPLITRLVPFRWKHPLGPLTTREEKRLIWREDMPEFVLERMRKHVLKKLKDMHGAQKRSKSGLGSLRIIEIKDSSYDALLEGLGCLEKIERMECGGVLVMDRQLEQRENGDSSTGQEQAHDHESAKSPYPDLVTLPQSQSKVPVFDLTELLSQADLAEVRDYGALFGNTALILSPDNPAAVQALLALWKLKAFLRPQEA